MRKRLRKPRAPKLRKRRSMLPEDTQEDVKDPDEMSEDMALGAAKDVPK